MYRTGRNYKVETKKGIFYTGTVIGEDNFSISISTIRREEIVINKNEIARAKLLEDRTEENGFEHD